jgi:hypothetical protein
VVESKGALGMRSGMWSGELGDARGSRDVIRYSTWRHGIF